MRKDKENAYIHERTKQKKEQRRGAERAGEGRGREARRGEEEEREERKRRGERGEPTLENT